MKLAVTRMERKAGKSMGGRASPLVISFRRLRERGNFEDIGGDCDARPSVESSDGRMGKVKR